MGADLSRTFSAAPRTCSHGDAMDLVKKPEWYHRHQVGCGPEPSSPFGCRSSSSSSYGPLSSRLHPDQAPVHCRSVEQHLYHRVQGRWLQGCYGPDRTGSPLPESSGRDESDSDSDVIFLLSSTEEPVLCSPFLQDPGGHAVEPLSPAASSLDEGPGCYRRPHPLSSPSPDSSYSEDSSDSSLDVLLHRARPVVLLSELSAVYQSHAHFGGEVSSDDSDVIEVALAPEEPGHGLLGQERRLGDDEEEAPPTEVRRSGRIRRSVSDTPPSLRRTSRRRLKRRAKNDAVGIYYESCESDDVVDLAARLSGSDADDPLTPLEAEGRSPQTASEPRRDGSRSVSPGPNTPLTNQTERGETGGDQRPQRVAPEPPRNRKTGSRKPTRRWRKKRRLQAGPAARFSASEPEIRLRYAEVKEEKKRKPGGFCPFVHVDKRTCVIVNFREDEDGVRSGPGARAGPRSVPGFVPSTSCFQPCRFSSDGARQAAPLCCLCGQTANAMGLGDLHGPYRPASPSRSHQNQNGWAEADGGGGAAEPAQRGDCGSPPKVPPERWIHEDCGIWAAGVFLVRGRLYGLEEAARLAQETVSEPRETQRANRSERGAELQPLLASGGPGRSTPSPVFASFRCVPCANRLVQLWDVS